MSPNRAKRPQCRLQFSFSLLPTIIFCVCWRAYRYLYLYLTYPIHNACRLHGTTVDIWMDVSVRTYIHATLHAHICMNNAALNAYICNVAVPYTSCFVREWGRWQYCCTKQMVKRTLVCSDIWIKLRFLSIHVHCCHYCTEAGSATATASGSDSKENRCFRNNGVLSQNGRAC